MILPVPDLGSDSTNSTMRGALYAAIFARAHVMMSSSAQQRLHVAAALEVLYWTAGDYD